MNFIKRWLYLPVGLGTIVLVFIVTGLFDVVIAVFYSRFYSSAAFIASFAVGGVFAALLGYAQAIGFVEEKNEFSRWSIIILTWITALLFIFLFSALEGGEYEPAFIAFGITLALTTLLFVRGRIDI